MRISAFILLFIMVLPMAMNAQDTDPVLLRGKVLYRNSNVPNQNVINLNTERATVTNDDGEFEILVNEGDELVFTSLNYQLRTVEITQEILTNNRLVVEVNEKVTELDEVVVSPENEEAFIKLKEEEFKEVVYEKDKATPVVNYALPEYQQGMQYGVNFVNIFKALFKSKKEKDNTIELRPSQVLRQVYDDEFFVVDLKIPQEQIDEFLYYLDDRLPSQTLLKKDREFELIDFLVNESKNYKVQKTTRN
ncbi:carboxypeptidase-like regulatory domain-containing protein [Galbibacter sp. EGI 63066]|uniref:carboxypeptidase-like regulatory domain-containing protein n=1 Tax=Galbibacter sp. EGI 63066 TaxID=2993559 RepID=UPI0022489022|nr:carboxypeptidase-like regulatory domain-containing protein [Galbibacter sp. EGI 63066]MCX2680394.1 carboxypeptidase-like regulatory domain-containing protein [Galbibacter sp. EGI 63066]